MSSKKRSVLPEGGTFSLFRRLSPRLGIYMRMICGAILLLASEQAFAHAHLIGFPHQEYVGRVLIPSSAMLSVLGLMCLIWGLLVDGRK
jgi:hypothetical protein